MRVTKFGPPSLTKKGPITNAVGDEIGGPRHMRRFGTLYIALGFILVGCGVAPKPLASPAKSLAASHEVKTIGHKSTGVSQPSASTHRVNAGRMSVVLPRGWSHTSTTTTYGVTTWTFQSNDGQLQLSAAPMATNHFQLLPMLGYPSGNSASSNHRPYQRETIQSGGTEIIDRVLSARGTLYRFVLQMGPSSQAKTIFKSW